MAKTGEKDKITEESEQSEDYEEPHPYAILVEDIFFQPHSAFDSFVNKEELGGKDILNIHLILSFLAPLGLVFQNIFRSLYGFFLYKNPILIGDFFTGTLKAWVFMVGVVFLVRFFDIFRLYYRYWDRRESWDPPPSWIIMIAFIPFTSSGIFFFLPLPFNLAMIGIAFLYSLHLSYSAMENLTGYSGREFLSFLLQFLIFLSMITAVILGIYNMIRTLQS